MTDVAGVENAWALPKLDHHPQRAPRPLASRGTPSSTDKMLPPTGNSRPAHCRRKKRMKKREYKSAASVLTASGASGRSTTDRSINSASSVFPTSTPLDSPTSSKPSSRSNSLRTSGTKLLKSDAGEEEFKARDLLDSDNESLGFDPVYSHDYDLKKERVLKGKFKEVLNNYFPDLIRSNKMVIPDASPQEDEDYDTDLDEDLDSDGDTSTRSGNLDDSMVDPDFVPVSGSDSSSCSVVYPLLSTSASLEPDIQTVEPDMNVTSQTEPEIQPKTHAEINTQSESRVEVNPQTDRSMSQTNGLELLADEHAKSRKEDGLCAEYKQRCRKYKVVPNSFFLRHTTDDELRLRYRYLGYGDSATMSHEIQNQPSVTCLDLEDNALGPAGMLCFAEMLKSNAYITQANFAYNELGVFGARLMKFILLKNVRLVKLNVAGNKFGERGAKYCAIAINSNSTLKELDISHNGISDEGATLVGKALANNNGLEVLNMSWNNFGHKGATNLAKGLKINSKLRVLNLSMNGCHEEGSRALISALKYNSTLEDLDLSNNRVGEEGAKTLTKSLPYLRLQAVHLAFNPLGAEWTEKILRALLALEDGPLKLINMEGVVVEDDFQLLAEALQHKDVTVLYKIPPSSRERSRDIPLETLNHVVNFLDDVEMELSAIVPQPSGGDVIMTVEDLFKQLEASGMFKESSRLMKLKQDSQRNFRRRFLVKELYMVMTRRRQSLNEVMFTAQAVDELDLTDSVDPLTTERSSYSDQTFSI